MIIYICSFTDKGREKSEQLNTLLTEDIVRLRNGKETREFVEEAFRLRAPLIFIGAVGIAVRMIAPFVKDKLTDPPVLVIDDKGEYVIPILSGHMGGGNELADKVATLLEAKPVITTATDVNNVFAIDVFAKRNNLKIINRDGIAAVSSKLLKGEKASVCIPDGDDFKCKLPIGVLLTTDDLKDADIYLEKKTLTVGIGCKKGTEPKKLLEFADRFIDDWTDVIGIASIDLKAREDAIAELASIKGVPFKTYNASELLKVMGSFEDSPFVKDVTGVGNVCERSAVALAMEAARCPDDVEVILHKFAEDGMTIAVAKL